MFGERYKKHLKAPSPIFEHQINTGHIPSVENFKIIGREGHNMAKAIKEAMYIRVKQSYFEQEYWKIQPATPLG